MLKQLIQRLLDSRTTPAQAAHSALRNTSSSTSIFTGEQIYTAPEDGFITVEGKSEANGGSAIGISSNGENYFLRTFQSVKDWGQAVTAPVSKGETVSISLYNLTDIEVKFYKSFGGGYNILVRRALSCLRPSFNYLPRSFCKAKNNGSAAKPFLIQELNSVTQQEGMLLQRTDTSVSSMQAAQEAVCFLTSTQERIQMCHRQIVVSGTVGCLLRTLTWGLLSLLKKECQSILRRIQSQNRFGSVQRQGGVNFRTGGALC